jgi:ATP-dependent DNA helicase RecG
MRKPAGAARASVRGEAMQPLAPRLSKGARGDVWGELTPAMRTRLAKLGITRTADLVLHLPLRYDDETQIYPINAAPAGQPVVVEGNVVDCDVKYRPRRQLVCHMEDGSATLMLRFLNFYPSQVKQLSTGVRVRAFGEIRHGFFGAEMVHPRYRVLHGDMPVPNALTPVYPTTAGLGQDALRRLIARAVTECDLSDTLSEALLKSLKLPRFADAVRHLHSPAPRAPQSALVERRDPAWRRIKFDELLAQQLSMRLHYQRRRAAGAPPLRLHGTLTHSLVERLPFKLTRAQRKALAEIQRDLAQPYPMQRLLQGDVGSGKTVIAALAALQCMENGLQVAVMAPTEILAEQHYKKFQAWVPNAARDLVWLAGSLRKKDKAHALAEVAAGSAKVIVGTHALFQEEVQFQKLGLAIVDEQHRFGVHQRLALRMKGGRVEDGTQPHQLMMSATPIPRTLAMSFYADLDVSVIDEMPPGRAPVATKLVSEARRDEVIHRIRDACIAGSQAYWVCPLIEDSEALQLKTALETYDAVRTTFPELKVGLVHGRLKPEEKSAVMQAFAQGEIHLLVATTVIEVGVDVANATLMVIEHAERMGLSQLHQLRGRVGRGSESSTCILLYQNPLTATARERLKIIFENSDGFEIARHDLRLRGPGELLGARQSGVPMLRFADLTADVDLLEQARSAAERLVREQSPSVAAHLARWMGERHDLLKV